MTCAGLQIPTCSYTASELNINWRRRSPFQGTASLLKVLAYRRRWFKLVAWEEKKKKGIHPVCPWTPGAPSVQTAIKCSFVIWIESSLHTGARLLGPKQKCVFFYVLCFAAIRKMARLRFNSFLLLQQWFKNQLRRLTRPHLQFISVIQHSSESWEMSHCGSQAQIQGPLNT